MCKRWKRNKKLAFLANEIMVCLENSRTLIDRLLELIRQFNKMLKYKIKMYKHKIERDKKNSSFPTPLTPLNSVIEGLVWWSSG